MAFLSNRPNAIASSGNEPLHLSETDIDLAMDMIAQIVPHLDLQDCQKVAELAEAQATLIEVMGDRQAAAMSSVQQHWAA